MLKSYLLKQGIEAGCDEAGRGCLAGPVYAAAVILPRHFKHSLLNDSKQLTEKQRLTLKEVIEKEAMSWAVAKVLPKTIDKINILRASFRAMHLAIDRLKIVPDRLLIDGNRFVPYKKLEYHTLIKGDAHYLSIAAASILAKTHRDAYMLRAHKNHPHYGWIRNKGYPTQEHREALQLHGPCECHRRSFRLLPFPVQGDLFGS